MGATTSGHVLLYDAGGVLRFAGGITDGRGHEGDNAGLDAALALLRGHVPEVDKAAASTIRRRLAALSSLMKHLTRHGHLSKNHVAEVERPAIQPGLQHRWRLAHPHFLRS